MTAAVPAGAAAPDFAALELVGTSIDAGKRFALVKRRDDALLTLDQGSQLSGYTVASIEPDRVTLTSPSGARAVILLAGSDPASPAIGSARYAAESRLITDGVNTDQSLPKDPVWGPTARLPEGVKQIGH